MVAIKLNESELGMRPCRRPAAYRSLRRLSAPWSPLVASTQAAGADSQPQQQQQQSLSANSQNNSFSAVQVVDDLSQLSADGVAAISGVDPPGPLLSLMLSFDLSLEPAAFVLHACHGVLRDAVFVLASGGRLRSNGLPVWTAQDDADVLSDDADRMQRVCDQFGQLDVCLRLLYLTGCPWPEPDCGPSDC